MQTQNAAQKTLHEVNDVRERSPVQSLPAGMVISQNLITSLGVPSTVLGRPHGLHGSARSPCRSPSPSAPPPRSPAGVPCVPAVADGVAPHRGASPDGDDVSIGVPLPQGAGPGKKAGLVKVALEPPAGALVADVPIRRLFSRTLSCSDDVAGP